MFKLRTLIFILILPQVFVISQKLMAAEGTVGFDIIFVEQRGSLDVFRPVSDQEGTSFLSRFSFQAPTLKNYWTLATVIDVAKRDYSNFLLRDAQGVETPLSETFDQPEYASTLTLTYQKQQNSVSFLLGSNLGESPLPFFASSISYDHTSIDKKRTLGARLIGVKKEQPASTFIDPVSLETRQRPTELTSYRYEAHWTEILTQRWKMDLRGFLGTRKVDRPDHYGLELKNALVVGDNKGFRLHTGFLQERNTDLKDDRGRFSMLWLESAVYLNFLNDYNLEASYGVVSEKEKLQDGRNITIGTDSYGLKLNYEGVNKLFTLGYIFRNTNTKYKTHTLQGGIKWTL